MKIRVLAVAFVLAAAASASTVTISFTGLPQYQANGYYVGNTKATVGDSPFDLLCADFTSTTYVPSGPFTFSVSALPSLTNVRFTGADTLTKYETAAILLYTLDGLERTSSYAVGSYQYAIWKLFTPSVGDYGDSAALLASAQTTVANGGMQTAYDALRVFTPTQGSASNQEFLAIDYTNRISAPPNAAAVPEQSTFLQLGSGLLLLAGAFKRWRQS